MIVNKFIRGVNKMVDYGEIPQNFMVDAENIRLLTVEGKGLIVVSHAGNEYSFELPDGFIPMGSAEYNGIAYIASMNPVSGECEWGTFPGLDNGVFVHEYKPLRNYTGKTFKGLRDNFRTDLFNWDPEYPLWIEARIDYDNSVNLYFADAKNPFRSINAGFDQSGKFNNRLYWEGSFPSLIDVISESVTWLNAEATVQSGGKVKCGLYHILFRYQDDSFNSTSVAGYSSPVQIGLTDDSKGIQVSGGDGTQESNNKITINLTNINNNYTYVEVILIRYSSGSFECSILANKYLISGTQMSISITGNEIVTAYTYEEAIKRKIIFDIPEAITQLNNKMFIANLYKRETHHPDMYNLAQGIQLGHNRITVQDRHWEYVPDPRQHKESGHTNKYVSYFNSEAYPFSIQFILKDGRVSKDYPVKGYDCLTGKYNKNGIYRFPFVNDAPWYDLNPDQLKVLGITYTLTNNALVTQWIKDNVSAFVFKRGERKENLVTQGIMLQTFNAHNHPSHIFRDSTPTNALSQGVNTENYMPMWKFIVPHQQPKIEGDSDTYWPGYNFTPVVPIRIKYDFHGYNDEYYTSMNVYPEGTSGTKRYGLFSHDNVLMNGEISDGDYFINIIGEYKFKSQSDSNSFYYRGLRGPDNPGSYEYGYDPNTGYRGLFGASFYPIDFQWFGFSNSDMKDNAKATSIKRYDANPISKFVSKYHDGYENDPMCYWHADYNNDKIKVGNLEFGCPAYLGLETEKSHDLRYPYQTGNINHWQIVPIVNVYKTNPENIDIEFYYLPEYTQYFAISQSFLLAEIYGIGSQTFFNGDCFLQKNYIRQIYHHEYYDSNDNSLDGGRPAYFILHGYTSQNKYNHAMRGYDDKEDYWPRHSINLKAWCLDIMHHESLIYNPGYHKVLAVNPGYGFNINQPVDDLRLHTRVAVSTEHKNESFKDGYKIFDLTSYVDYDYKHGEIKQIHSYRGGLLIVQEKAVSLAGVDERVYTPTEASISPGTFLLGKGSVLAPIASPITTLTGSQHRDSVKKFGESVYGVDANKRKAWQLAESFDIISESKGFEPDLYNLFESVSDHSDILHKIGRSVVYSSGVATYVDSKNKEILFLIKMSADAKINCLKFNASGQQYLGRLSSPSAFYININKDFFAYDNNVEFWKEIDAIGSSFFGVAHGGKISIVVNGKEQQLSELTKYFENIEILSGSDQFKRITFETEDQQRIHDPFIDTSKPHILPVYKDNKWLMPVGRSDSTGTIYSAGSDFRGGWLKITIEWDTDSKIYIRSIHTEIKQSMI